MSTLLEHLKDLKKHRDKASRPEFLAMVWLAIDGHLDELVSLATGVRSEIAAHKPDQASEGAGSKESEAK